MLPSLYLIIIARKKVSVCTALAAFVWMLPPHVRENPRLFGLAKPGSIIIPLDQERQIYFLNPEKFPRTIERNEIALFAGDVEHGGMTKEWVGDPAQVDGGPVTNDPSLHIYVLSDHHPLFNSNLLYDPAPDTYMPKQHIKLLSADQKRDRMKFACTVQHDLIEEELDRGRGKTILNSFLKFGNGIAEKYTKLWLAKDAKKQGAPKKRLAKTAPENEDPAKKPRTENDSGHNTRSSKSTKSKSNDDDESDGPPNKFAQI